VWSKGGATSPGLDLKEAQAPSMGSMEFILEETGGCDSSCHARVMEPETEDIAEVPGFVSQTSPPTGLIGLGFGFADVNAGCVGQRYPRRTRELERDKSVTGFILAPKSSK
jgi:hypothetical protein